LVSISEGGRMETVSNKALIRKFIEKKMTKTNEHVHIDDEYNIITAGIIDSLGIMQLVAYIEETFSIMINDEDIIPDHFESIQAISLFIEDKQDRSVTGDSVR
jgi:acyl carrier protein